MSKPLVFIIDDDKELSKVIERRFIVFGCEVACFTDPEALYLAYEGKRKPRLIVVDLNLGEGISGFDIIRKLREEKHSDVPIVILSGETDSAQIAHGIELGANDYIVKPPMRLDFEEIIAKHLKAEFLPEPIDAAFQPVKQEKRRATFRFPIKIEEVQPTGFTLRSDHLIKKGASFYIQGTELQKFLPTADQIFVTVIGSTARTLDHQKIYQLVVEIDPAQEVALGEVKKYLDRQFADQSDA